MLGLSVNAAASEAVGIFLDENKLTLNGRQASAIKDRFDRAVFPLRDETDAVLTKLLVYDFEGADPELIDTNTVTLTIKAAERKKPAYSARGATFARKRFDDIFGKVIQRPRRRGAHKGWVTRLEWNENERLGLWTHDWEVEYVFAGNTYKMNGQAVHEDRAWRDIDKSVKALAKSHRSARIRIAKIKKIKNKRAFDDVTKRAEAAFARAVK